jgi:hypothetical protein
MNLLEERIKALEAENARLKLRNSLANHCYGLPRKFPVELMRRPKSNSLGIEFRLMQDAGRKKSVFPERKVKENGPKAKS